MKCTEYVLKVFRIRKKKKKKLRGHHKSTDTTTEQSWYLIKILYQRLHGNLTVRISADLESIHADITPTPKCHDVRSVESVALPESLHASMRNAKRAMRDRIP